MQRIICCATHRGYQPPGLGPPTTISPHSISSSPLLMPRYLLCSTCITASRCPRYPRCYHALLLVIVVVYIPSVHPCGVDMDSIYRCRWANMVSPPVDPRPPPRYHHLDLITSISWCQYLPSPDILYPWYHH